MDSEIGTEEVNPLVRIAAALEKIAEVLVHPVMTVERDFLGAIKNHEDPYRDEELKYRGGGYNRKPPEMIGTNAKD